MYQETIESISGIEYKLSIWKFRNGWTRFTFEKVNDEQKKLSGKRSKIDVPDATRSCKAEYLEGSLSEARRDIERKQGRKQVDSEKPVL